jgi:hypothetical protein
MRAMKRALVFVVLGLAACGGSDDLVGQARQAKEDVCACSDPQCKVTAGRRFAELSSKIKDHVADLSADQRAEIAKSVREAQACLQGE